MSGAVTQQKVSSTWNSDSGRGIGFPGYGRHHSRLLQISNVAIEGVPPGMAHTLWWWRWACTSLRLQLPQPLRVTFPVVWLERESLSGHGLCSSSGAAVLPPPHPPEPRGPAVLAVHRGHHPALRLPLLAPHLPREAGPGMYAALSPRRPPAREVLACADTDRRGGQGPPCPAARELHVYPSPGSVALACVSLTSPGPCPPVAPGPCHGLGGQGRARLRASSTVWCLPGR